MRLLILTQVVDEAHPVLGFFHRWIEEFAKHCDEVTVICLCAGTHSLPANVHVYSLGKDKDSGRLTYLWRFYRLVWHHRHNYDHVFVHMNQVYVILGGLLWRAWGKRVGLWYMHGSVPLSLWVAQKLAHHIFTGSPESFRLASKKVLVTGHGIDTTHFVPDPAARKDIDLITVGRITPSKNLAALLELLTLVRRTHDVSLTVVGAPVTAAEQEYFQAIQAQVAERGLTAQVQFVGRVNQADLPATLARARVFVTAAQNGSLDKAVLEAMACGVSVVSMAPGLTSLQLGRAQTKSITDFAAETNRQLVDGSDTQSLVSLVRDQHSLQSLLTKLIAAYD